MDKSVKRGDLFLSVAIVNPPRLSSEQLELYEKLSRTQVQA